MLALESLNSGLLIAFAATAGYSLQQRPFPMSGDAPSLTPHGSGSHTLCDSRQSFVTNPPNAHQRVHRAEVKRTAKRSPSVDSERTMVSVNNAPTSTDPSNLCSVCKKVCGRSKLEPILCLKRSALDTKLCGVCAARHYKRLGICNMAECMNDVEHNGAG